MCVYESSIVCVQTRLSANSALRSSVALTATTYFPKIFPPHRAMATEGVENYLSIYNSLLLFSFFGSSTGWLLNVGYDVSAHDSNFCCWFPFVCRCMGVCVCMYVACEVSLKTGFEQQPLSTAQNWLLALSGSKSHHQEANNFPRRFFAFHFFVLFRFHNLTTRCAIYRFGQALTTAQPTFMTIRTTTTT